MYRVTYIIIGLLLNISLYAGNLTIGSCKLQTKSEIYHLYGDKGEDLSIFHTGKKIAQLTLLYRSGGCGQRVYEETIVRPQQNQLIAYTRYHSDNTVKTEEMRNGAQVTTYQIDSNCTHLIRKRSEIYLKEAKDEQEKEAVEKQYQATFLDPMAGESLVAKVDAIFLDESEHRWR